MQVIDETNFHYEWLQYLFEDLYHDFYFHV